MSKQAQPWPNNGKANTILNSEWREKSNKQSLYHIIPKSTTGQGGYFAPLAIRQKAFSLAKNATKENTLTCDLVRI